MNISFLAFCHIGRLRFTNVKASDEEGGRAYSCMAINYFMRDNAIGPEHVVDVIGSKFLCSYNINPLVLCVT